MDSDGADVTELPLRLFDDIWGQWNQCNDLSLGMNGPSSVRQRQRDGEKGTAFTEVFDADFKYLYEVPSHLVVHTPSARLNITRLVFCRNYRPYEPDSCKMRDGCKFVHADVDMWTLKAFSIHVNYIWSHEDLCTYDHLSAGEVVEVLSSDVSTVKLIPSERIIVTCGALARHETAEPLIRCKYFELNQTCFAGDRCNYIHVMCVDPNVRGVFKRVSKTHLEANHSATGTSFQSSHLSRDRVNKSAANNNNQSVEGFHGLRAAASCWVPNANVSLEPMESASIDFVNRINSAVPLNYSQNISSPAAEVTGGIKSTARPTFSESFSAETLAQQLFSLFSNRNHSEYCLQDYKTFPTVTDSYSFSNSFLQGTQASGGVGNQHPADANDNGSSTSALTPEQLTGIISQIVSVFSKQVSQPRVVAVGMSPLLDDPNAIGTLLFLPRGATEATALQPVYDNWFLGLIAAMGLQQQRPASVPAQPTHY